MAHVGRDHGHVAGGDDVLPVGVADLADARDHEEDLVAGVAVGLGARARGEAHDRRR